MIARASPLPRLFPSGETRPAARALPPPPRILEIGSYGLFKKTFPNTTDLVWMEPHSELRLDFGAARPPGWPQACRLLRALRRGGYDLLVIHAPSRPLWRRRTFAGTNLLRCARDAAFCHRLLPKLAAAAARCPLIVLDLRDTPTLHRQNFPLLARADLVFKRELPVDFWNLFLNTGPRNEHPLNIGRQPFFQSLRPKFRPISLGFPDADARPRPAEKKHDIFFAGSVQNLPLREAGLAELRQLARQGVRVHLPEKPLTHDEFMRACAEAWLVWSPAGGGWDCFRHYEAAIAGSVPLINAPSILRHAPLLHGVCALYYRPEPGGLTEAVHGALADKFRLSAIAAAGREHVLAHHLHSRLCDYVLAEWRGVRETAVAASPKKIRFAPPKPALAGLAADRRSA